VTGPRVVVAHVPDLMDRSKLTARDDIDVTFVRDPAELAATARELAAAIVVVDLSRPGVLDALAAGGLPERVIGFGSHVDRDLLDAARQTGGLEVMPRSQFFGRLDTVLATAPPD
jgi:hypothetical protein